MPSPKRFYVRVNSLAASQELPRRQAEIALDQALIARPDATIEFVELSPDGVELGAFVIQQGTA